MAAQGLSREVANASRAREPSPHGVIRRARPSRRPRCGGVATASTGPGSSPNGIAVYIAVTRVGCPRPERRVSDNVGIVTIAIAPWRTAARSRRASPAPRAWSACPPPSASTSTSTRSICQVPGEGYRLPARAFREAIERSRPLDALIWRYAAVVLRQTGQGVACNALHPVPERLSRWLLMSHDRVGRDEFPMTHEFMGELLGVRRPTVTVAAGTLQAAGLITFRRGHHPDRRPPGGWRRPRASATRSSGDSTTCARSPRASFRQGNRRQE